MKNTIISLVVIVLVALAGYGIYKWGPSFSATNTQTPTTSEPTTTTEPAPVTQATSSTTVIGNSAGGHDITAYTYGTGSKEILFVGGIHGAYEWNTILLARQLMDYLAQNPSAVPAGEKVTVIPLLNPDGLYKIITTTGTFSASDMPAQAQTVAGRFNAHTVDLNRNFDCDWKSQGVWQNTTVSGGASAFSEPESQAIKTYVEAHKPTAVVVWYSSAGGVFASSCHNGVASETSTLTQLFANASGYKAYQDFDFYTITGDMVNWLAKSNIPAISVLLTNHTDTEWDKNLAGVKAVLSHYAQ